MKQIIKFVAVLIGTGFLFFTSCKKELSCDNCGGNNKPPIANAGPDQTIILPIDSVSLDGSASSDPDGTIISFQWTKISGPGSFIIMSASTAKSAVKQLAKGVYLFELKVTDNGGLTAKDTMQVKVNAGTVNNCDISNRALINAQLIPVNNLSQTREGMVVASAANKTLFAGGVTSGNAYSSRVDIFDISTNSWSTAELSEPRSGIAKAVLGNKIFFAGGSNGTAEPSSRVDIYDAVANTWTTAQLSIGRTQMTGAAAGNKVVFAGGLGFFTKFPAPPVDVYDVSTNTWTTDILRERPTSDIIGDAGIAATVIGTKIYFAGNASDWWAWDFGSITSTINIYDAATNGWSTSDMDIPRGYLAGIAVGNKNYWAGGLYKQPQGPFTNQVEIRDMNSGSSTSGCLFQPNAFFSAVLKNNKIVFFTSGVDVPAYWTAPAPVHNKFDIYDIATNTWSIGVLPANIVGSSIISVNNIIYVAGGTVNGTLSNQVWKLEF